jgi:hypothetical protein
MIQPVRTAAVIALVAALAALAGSAWAAGGSSISGAVAMPLGTQVQGGALRTKKLNGLPWAAEYWSVAMRPGDHLVVDYSASNQLGVGLCLLAPSVTDFTEQTAQCLASAITGTNTEMKFTAPVAGAYTARFSVNVCQCTDPLSYSFDAHVLSPTHLTLRVPKTVRAGATVRIVGMVGGGPTGSVAVRIGGPLNRRHVIPIRAGGRFTTSFKLPFKGSYTVSASFYGDPSHLESSGTAHIAAR